MGARSARPDAAVWLGRFSRLLLIKFEAADHAWAPLRDRHFLVPESQLRNDLTVSLNVRTLHVFQKASTAADHFEEAAAAVVILFVRVEMRPEVVDTRREDCSLDGSAPDVAVVELMLLDDFFSTDRHLTLCLRRSLRYKGSSQCFR